MTEIRARVDAIVDGPGDRRGAQALVPPAVQAAVLPRRVPAGLQRARTSTWSTPTARASSASTRPACGSAACTTSSTASIFASGFEVGTDYARRSGFETVGRDGAHAVASTGPTACRRLHGIHVHGFPNLFVVGLEPGRQPDLEHHPQPDRGRHDDRRGRRPRARRSVPTRSRSPRRPSRRGSRCSRAAPQSFLGNPDCTPGYYNNEGRPVGRRERLNASGYPAGPVAYFEYIDGWRSSGEFEGLEFRSGSPAPG